MNVSIGIDLGGTRIKGIVLDQSNNILHQLYTPTNDGAEGVWKTAVLDTVQQLLKKTGAATAVVGISAPGLANETNTAVACMPGRLQGLENFIWSEFLGHPAFVLNDAIAALMAEARIEPGTSRLAYFTSDFTSYSIRRNQSDHK